MIWPAEDLDALYADFGETVSRSNGAADFLAIDDTEDVDVFGTGTTTDRQLRYQASTTLVADEVLVIAGESYKVSKAPPRRLLDGRECVARMVKL